MSVSRNAPCPCGSGKKYKQCCMGRLDRRARRRLLVIAPLFAAGVVAIAIWVGMELGVQHGVLAGLVGLAGIGIFLAIRRPPRSRGRKGADSINFGR